MNTLTFDFDPLPTVQAAVRRVPVRSHLRRVRGDVESPAPYVKGSQTSQAAAEGINAAGQAGAGRGRILAALVTLGPMTDEEIGAACGMGGDTVRPRRGELKSRGLIRENGDTRPTKSGRLAVVWEAMG